MHTSFLFKKNKNSSINLDSDCVVELDSGRVSYCVVKLESYCDRARKLLCGQVRKCVVELDNGYVLKLADFVVVRR